MLLQGATFIELGDDEGVCGVLLDVEEFHYVGVFQVAEGLLLVLDQVLLDLVHCGGVDCLYGDGGVLLGVEAYINQTSTLVDCAGGAFS